MTLIAIVIATLAAGIGSVWLAAGLMSLGAVASAGRTQQGRVGPHMLYNVSLSYDLSEKSALSLTVNNVLNTRPPLDRTYDGSQGFAPPFYNIFAYNGYGRAFWLQYRIDFGTN